jgi:hypothetical protein
VVKCNIQQHSTLQKVTDIPFSIELGSLGGPQKIAKLGIGMNAIFVLNIQNQSIVF